MTFEHTQILRQILALNATAAEPVAIITGHDRQAMGEAIEEEAKALLADDDVAGIRAANRHRAAINMILANLRIAAKHAAGDAETEAERSEIESFDGWLQNKILNGLTTDERDTLLDLIS